MKRYLFSLAFLAALLGVAQNSLSPRLLARGDFAVSPLWHPKIIMGRDFWNKMEGTRYSPLRKNPGNILYFPTSELPAEMRRHMDIPAFREVMIKVSPPLDRQNISKNDDGTISLRLHDQQLDWIPPELPFVLPTHRYTRNYPENTDIRFLLKPRKDWDYFQAWRQQHPNFFAFEGLGEWGNNAAMIFPHITRSYIAALQNEDKNKPEKNIYLSEEEVEQIAARYVRNPPTRRDYVNQRLKSGFDDGVKVTFADAGSNTALDGAYNVGHLAAYWGAKCIDMESARVYNNWQYMMMFYRGAARQFNTFWGWYAASHATIYDERGNSKGIGAEPCAWIPKGREERCGPDCGASLNSRERASFMAYLSGANYYMRETVALNYWDATATGDERWKPAPEGQMYIDFFNFTRRHQDRGTPYTPIALLVAHDRGAGCRPGKAFWRYPYVHSDNMLDAFVKTIFPTETPGSFHLKGIEMTLMNSKYGDFFDVLTPDFEKSDRFASILPAYKVAILIGEYENNAGMIEALTSYVNEGGTLILNAKQLNLHFPPGFTGIILQEESSEGEYRLTKLHPETASVLLHDAAQRPLFTRNLYGKGAVIVSAIHYLTPYFDDSNEKNANTVLNETLTGKREFPYIKWLLDRLLEEVRPAKVEGDIQYGFNRTRDGWWIYLFNNKGILKTALTPQKLDMAAKTLVSIDLQEIPLASVTELLSGETFAGRQFDIPVDPGKCRILKVTLQR